VHAARHDHHPRTALNNVSLRAPGAGGALDALDALNALDDGYCIVGGDRRVLFVNDAFTRVFGGEPSACVGRELRHVLPVLCAEVDAALRATEADGAARSVRKCVAAGRAGERPELWFDVRVTRVAGQGAPGGRGLAIQLRDVTAVVRAERELRERSEENESLRDVANALAEEADLGALLRLICTEAAAQCEADGAAVLEIAEGEASAVASAGLLEHVRGRRHALAGSLAERAIAERRPVRAADYPAEYRGRAFAAEGRAAGVGPLLLAPLIAHGETLGVLTIGRRKEREPFDAREVQRIRGIADHAALAVWKTRLFERAQEANRAKSEFMAMMSHELRTPLTAIQGYEELMADGILGPLSDEQRQALDRMRWSTQLLTAIVEEILIYSKLEAKEVVARPVETTAQEVIAAVAAVLEPLASARGLAFRAAAPDEPLPLVTDPSILRRVLVNLGANAVKFTDQGAVELEARREGSEVRFGIRDTGIGIAAHDLQRLFQPFTQLQGGMTRRYGGTGLGLYTAWRLTQLLGGRIDVRSEPGEGSTFTVVVRAE
jgi:PAS domain S-box-containing protein